MASRTALQLIILTNQQTGLDVVDGTFNGSGNTTTTGQVTALENQPDTRYIGRHLYIDGGSPSIRSHTLKNSTQANGELTWHAALGAAPDSLDFLILPFSRDDTVNAIVDTVLMLHDEGALVRPIVSWGLVGGSPLYNAGWDYWTGTNTVDGWTKNGSGTVERERPADGSVTYTNFQALKLRAVADYVYLNEPWDKYLEDFKGHTVSLFCPVWTNNASHGRINLYADASNYSDYHSGNSTWEVLKVENVAVPEATSTFRVQLHNDDTNAVYFGRPWITSNVTVRDYPFPSALFTRINTVSQSIGSLHVDGNADSPATHISGYKTLHNYEELFFRDEGTSTEIAQLHFSAPPTSEAVLRMEGSGPLAIPSADSDQVEVDQTESYLIATLAAAKLLEDRAPNAGEPIATNYRRKASDLRQRAEQLKKGYSRARSQPPTLQVVM